MANLSALLEREASAEIETILSEARARASEIVAKAEDDAKATAASREGTLDEERRAESENEGFRRTHVPPRVPYHL